MNDYTSDPLSPAFVLPFNSAILGSEYRPLKPGMMTPVMSPYWLLIQDTSLVVCEIDGKLQLPEGDPPPWCPASSDALCIGIWRDRPLFTLPLAKTVEIATPYQTIPFNGPDATLDERLSTLAGIANQIIKWEQKSRYCGCCELFAYLLPAAGLWTVK